MWFMLNRMFFYFTLVAYLVVGAFTARVLLPETTTISFESQYLNLFKSNTVKASQVETLVAPEIAFNEIVLPAAPVAKPAPVKQAVVAKKAAKLKIYNVSKAELPFHEPVVLEKVVMNSELQTNLVALYQDFQFEEKAMMVAEVAAPVAVKDEVKVAQSQAVQNPKEEELTFFEYSNTEEEKTVAAAPVQDKSVPVEEVTTNAPAEEISVTDLVAFDYSQAKADIAEATKAPEVPVAVAALPAAGVTTQAPIKDTKWEWQSKSSNKKTTPVVSQNEYQAPKSNNFMAKSAKSEEVTTHYSRVTVQATGTDLTGTNNEVGFELRFADEMNDTYQDYNAGTVTVEADLNSKSMTRTAVLLKRGFAPTNTDLILEEGVSEVSLPLIEENTFNNLLKEFEQVGPVGALLVELDDETEGAMIDVPFGKVIQLDGELRKTKSQDFRYQLFIGVKAGNAYLTYKKFNGEKVAKIAHIHERELTYEANFYENSNVETFKLYEEDLLAKEKTPLIIGADQVRQFATEKTSKKIDNHTHKVHFGQKLLGARQYLELSHQQEPVFVGVNNNNKIKVPSENFMRYILSRFEGAKLGNRCLVQVNLSKKVAKVDVGSEAPGDALVTYTQVLDTDGKFYDSASDKSVKIIVVGENNAAVEIGQDGKINFKITYQDGSVDYLGSYCSPNSYLVEQL